MSNTNEITLVSLFHTPKHASQAMSDLQNAGVPQQSIQSIGGGNSASSAPEQSLAALKNIDLPADDLRILSDGLKNGGTLIIVRAEKALADKAQMIFEHQDANQIDERGSQASPVAKAADLTNETMIPVVEEQLVVGKRKVQQGGVRVFTRVVETPVEEQVTLNEEHATFERHAVNRPISATELDSIQNQTFEVREMGEEVVVGKTAHVVEEVRIGKESTQRTQTVKDMVRKTEIEVDQLAADDKMATGAAVGGKKS